MALVKYGGGIIQMSGSIAGTTFARNRFGNYARARTKPVNPNTDLQGVVRDAMSAMTTRWAQTLKDSRRKMWNTYAAGVAMKNRLGESVFLTGFNHYLRSNIPRVQAGLAVIDDGPTIFELPAKDPTFAITASQLSQKIEVTFDNAMDWAKEPGAYMLKYQGSPQNPQRNFFAGPWKFMDSIAGCADPLPSSPDSEDVVFPITELQRLWVYARITRADGRLSAPFRNDCFCEA